MSCRTDEGAAAAADKFFPKGSNSKIGYPTPAPEPPHCQKSFQTKFPGMRPESIFEFRPPSPPGGLCPRLRLAPVQAAHFRPNDHDGLHAPLARYCARKVCKIDSRYLAGKVYPHEIGIQETRTNHRKLDSQTALSH